MRQLSLRPDRLQHQYNQHSHVGVAVTSCTLSRDATAVYSVSDVTVIVLLVGYFLRVLFVVHDGYYSASESLSIFLPRPDRAWFLAGIARKCVSFSLCFLLSTLKSPAPSTESTRCSPYGEAELHTVDLPLWFPMPPRPLLERDEYILFVHVPPF
jgi:hypothetical protein